MRVRSAQLSSARRSQLSAQRSSLLQALLEGRSLLMRSALLGTLFTRMLARARTSMGTRTLSRVGHFDLVEQRLSFAAASRAVVGVSSSGLHGLGRVRVLGSLGVLMGR